MKAPELFRMKEHSARAITTTYKTLEKAGIDPVCGYVFTPLISLKTKVNDWQGSTDLVWDVQMKIFDWCKVNSRDLVGWWQYQSDGA